MARLKIAYVGGGSTRGAGTMASFIEQGENFSGSEIVLIDLDAERLELIRDLAQRMAAAKGVDLTVTATTDRRAGLDGVDAVLTSYRPGGFEARVLDERIPLSHGVIGQETQGPGGFFMALRSIHVMKGILEDLEAVAPAARIFNYTNPVNLVAQAVCDHSDVPFVSLCEGPIVFPEEIAEAAGLDPAKLDVASVGLNHGSWSVRAQYDGADLLPLVQAAYERRADDPELRPQTRRMLRLASVMGALPSEYFQYYYFEDEVLGELTSKPTTRAEDILSWVPGYWEHYVEQARSDRAGARPGPLARRHPRARAGDRLHGRGLQRPRRDAAGQRAEPGLDPRLPGLARRRDARRVRRAGHPPARDAGAAGAPARARRGARRVPAGGRRRGLVGGRARRGPRARGASARPLDRHGRAALRGDGRRAPRSTCPSGSSRPDAGAMGRLGSSRAAPP